MRPVTFPSAPLLAIFRRQTVASMPELMAALGCTARQTVLRKIKPLRYITSYSHRGSFYALEQSAAFDSDGLWSHGPARFSKHGTLLATVAALASRSDAGLFAGDLGSRLGVDCKDPLLRLVRLGRLARSKVDGKWLYCASEKPLGAQQLRVRKLRASEPQAASETAALAGGPDASTASAAGLFVGLLDERLRRLYAGLESLRRGRGGDRSVARWLGLDPGTVRRGRLELLSGEVLRDRVRKPGGGRKRLEKKSLQ